MTERRPTALLMVRPYEFAYNPQAAGDNAYMNDVNDSQIAAKALGEFDAMVETLEAHDIATLVVQDTPEPSTPDSLFPNNWASYHGDGTVVLYPMLAANRHAETEKDVIPTVRQHFAVDSIIDLRAKSASGTHLEGTGSIIFDRDRRVAYAGYSNRTNEALFTAVCELLAYEPIGFHATDAAGRDIYHTNVMMNIGNEYAVICMQAIRDQCERNKVAKMLYATDKRILSITQEQVGDFAGNMLQAYSRTGEPYTLLSSRAYSSLAKGQIKGIELSSQLLPIPVPTIETVGGGSVRCMLAEVYLPTASL